MADRAKKRRVNVSKKINKKKPDSDSSDGSDNGNEIYSGQEKIDVDFEGRNPMDSDFHGINLLLKRVFLKSRINLAGLSNLIIGQNDVGSVIKQSETEEDSDDEDDSDNFVYGVTTMINLTRKKDLECVKEVRTLLQELAIENASCRAQILLNSLLEGRGSLGWLINERVVNIPAQISVPLLESLLNEIKTAWPKSNEFHITHIVMICKVFKAVPGSKKKNKKKKAAVRERIIWANPEEELFDKAADCKYEVCVKGEADSSLSGYWTEDDVEMNPYRRVLVLRAQKLVTLIEQIKDFVSA